MGTSVSRGYNDIGTFRLHFLTIFVVLVYVSLLCCIYAKQFGINIATTCKKRLISYLSIVLSFSFSGLAAINFVSDSREVIVSRSVIHDVDGGIFITGSLVLLIITLTTSQKPMWTHIDQVQSLKIY